MLAARWGSCPVLLPVMARHAIRHFFFPLTKTREDELYRLNCSAIGVATYMLAHTKEHCIHVRLGICNDRYGSELLYRWK